MAPPQYQQTQQQDPEHDHKKEDPKKEADKQTYQSNTERSSSPFNKAAAEPEGYPNSTISSFKNPSEATLTRPVSKAMTTLLPPDVLKSAVISTNRAGQNPT